MGGDTRSRGRSRRRQRGFTLLELLITLSVTTIGLIGLLSLHLSVARGNDGASRSAEAQQIGSSQLESLRALRLGALMMWMKNTSDPTVVLPTPARTGTIARPDVTIAGRGGMLYTVTSTVVGLPAAGASLMRIRVVTQWTEDGAALGANGGQLDHSLALEVVRTKEDVL